MSVDTLSNMLSMVKNAIAVGNFTVELPYATINENVAIVLKQAGFFTEVRIYKEKGKPYKNLAITVADVDGVSRINEIKRISKPGRRIYKGWNKLKPVLSGFGISVISTPRGILSDNEARKRKLGGEVLCEIW